MFKTIYNLPDEYGHFGIYGGFFVPETLISHLNDIKYNFFFCKKNTKFLKKLYFEFKNFIGRPTPIFYAKRLSKLCGSKIFFKREDLNHTGSHKINNVIGQILIAKKMKKKRIIAETGAGQHGVAVATIASKFGLKCTIYMGYKDIKRQNQNVNIMKLLGTEIKSVNSGSKTLKDALSEAIRDWVINIKDTFYIIGSVTGPYPYPLIVKYFQSIIGLECKNQMFELINKHPNYIIACIGGGSNSIGIFLKYLCINNVNLIGIEAAGNGLNTNLNSATLNIGKIGVLHGTKTYILQDNYGQICNTHSISAGLDYPGVGPEHSLLKDIKRIFYSYINDKESISAFYLCSNIEGIIPALESSHAISYALKLSCILNKNQSILVNLSGRGNKDINNFINYNDI